MRYLNTILLLIFVSNFSFAQKAEPYPEKFGKLIITLPSKPDSIDLFGTDKMLISKTDKGVLNVSNVDASHRLNPLPSKNRLKEFYIEEVNWLFADKNVNPEEIDFFKIGTYDAACFLFTDQSIGIGYCVIVLIGKEFYLAAYMIPSFDKKELEYTKKQYMELFAFNNSIAKNEK